jgi:1-acyl-sn-glycerol-3-phosphate acyltransferase
MNKTKRNRIDILIKRTIGIFVYFFMLAIVMALLPALLAFAFTWDLIRRNSWSLLRCLAFLVLYLGAEVLGVTIAFGIWIFSGRFIGLGKIRFIDWSYLLQRWWGGWLFHGTFYIFGMQLEIDEPEGLDQGPLMLFIRHASMPDTSLPGALFVLRHNIRLRHIIKKELLWSPFLNIVCKRLGHHFLDRDSKDTGKELRCIGRLAEGMGPKDGIMIYPEGTRFTPDKRKRILEKISESGNDKLLEKARALRNVLPPRLGGSLTILEANTRAYAVFCAHVGFDAATKALNLLNGSLINQKIKIKMWKVPFENIPATREEQIEWLYHHWMKIDEWIEHKKQNEPALFAETLEPFTETG